MISDHRNLLLGGLLAGLGLASGWLLHNRDQEPAYRPKPHSPDYYLEGFNATTMGVDGKPDKQLSGERLAHFPEDDSTELKAPRMHVYEAEAPPWRIRSESGWISGDRQLILLQGKVNIDRDAAPGIRGFHIITRDLRIQPEENYAETDQQVFATSGDDHLESKGMQAWFAEPVRIKLLANVRGRYDPN